MIPAEKARAKLEQDEENQEHREGHDMRLGEPIRVIHFRCHRLVP
jgi:hypothetical protein